MGLLALNRIFNIHRRRLIYPKIYVWSSFVWRPYSRNGHPVNIGSDVRLSNDKAVQTAFCSICYHNSKDNDSGIEYYILQPWDKLNASGWNTNNIRSGILLIYKRVDEWKKIGTHCQSAKLE